MKIKYYKLDDGLLIVEKEFYDEDYIECECVECSIEGYEPKCATCPLRNGGVIACQEFTEIEL